MKAAYLSMLIVGICSSSAMAGLELGVPQVDVKPKPEDETISVDFSFTNTGKKAITILDLESGCACLSASLDQRTYAPGAKGTGKAEFKVGSFVGQHEKILTVHTDDPDQPQWNIPFLLDVPEVVSIEPKNVQWWIGEATTPKVITVKVTGKDDMKITNITSTREAVVFEWKTVKPGREYAITVTPKSTADVIIGALKVETDSSIPKYARQLAFFSIVRQPESRKGELTAGAKQP